LVDSWENEQQYWVYYSLSKSKYKEIKQQRIDKALEASKSEFLKARDFQADGNFPESMRFYMKSLDDVKDFLGDDLKTEIDGQQQNFSSLLISEMIRMIPHLKIVINQNLRFIRGVGHDNETIELTAFYDGQIPVKGVNIKAEFSYAPGKSTQNITDANGKIRIKNENFDTRKKEEYLSASVNIDRLIKESSTDQMIRKLLESIKLPVYVFPIEIISPKFYLVANEKNLGNDLAGSTLIRAFRGFFEKDGFEIVDNEINADYILRAEASTEKENEVNGKFSASLNAAFTLENRQGNIVYSEKLTGISGLGNNYQNAGEDAYRSLESKIRINIYPAM